jgi:cytochrome c5
MSFGGAVRLRGGARTKTRASGPTPSDMAGSYGAGARNTGSEVILQAHSLTGKSSGSSCGWRKKMAAMLAAVAAVLVVTIAPPGRANAAQQDSHSRLPEGVAKELISSKCGSACHDGGRVFDQPRTREEWTDVVVLMRDYGAPVSLSEQKIIVEYLAKNFGRAVAPAKPAGPPLLVAARTNAAAGARSSSAAAPAPTKTPMAAPSGQANGGGAQAAGSAANAGASAAPGGSLPPGPGKELVESKCTMCHNLDRIVESRRSPSEWQELVTTMEEFGADVSGNDDKVIVNYLSKSFPASGPAKGGGGNGGPAR